MSPIACSSACATSPRCGWQGVVTAEAAHGALELLEVDERGLDRLDREILEAICGKFAGGPVGLSTLAVAVGEEQDTIEDVYEPYLLQEGLIKRTPRGRAATPAAFEHLGLEPPPRPRASRCSEGRARCAMRRRRGRRPPPAGLRNLCGR